MVQTATPRSGGVVLGCHLTQLGTGYTTGLAHTQALRSTGSGLQLDLTAVRDQGISVWGACGQHHFWCRAPRWPPRAW